MKFPIIALLSWLLGLAAYPAACWLIYQQGVSRGDFVATAYRSFFQYHTCFLLIYIPAFCGLRRLLHGVRPRYAFAILGAALCFVPVLVWAGWPVQLQTRYVFSPESSLFYCFYAVSGITAGLGFTYGPNPRNG